jgi:hypothetical protein
VLSLIKCEGTRKRQPQPEAWLYTAQLILREKDIIKMDLREIYLRNDGLE